jgi:hypothetical protein
MADYVGAFNKGLEAAEVADRAKKEIDEVFAELKQQIYDATGGLISIDRRQYEVQDTSWAALLSFPPKPKNTFWAIVAHNPKIPDCPVKQLARWAQDRAGYPTKVVWAGSEHICEDKLGLQNSLVELLSDPMVGETLHGLKQLKVPAQDGTAQQEDAADKE